MNAKESCSPITPWMESRDTAPCWSLGAQYVIGYSAGRRRRIALYSEEYGAIGQSMSATPPFKLAPVVAFGAPVGSANPLLADALSRPLHQEDVEDESTSLGRSRLSALKPFLHCSVIGTCLTTETLRKVMRRFGDVAHESDATLHHQAVGKITDDPAAAKEIGRALDRQHDAVIQQFDRVRDCGELEAAWDQALNQGEIPGAYWAVLTHRLATPALRQRVFGDVHMLSHLAGAANRADIRRLMALQCENDRLTEQVERQNERSTALVQERDVALSSVQMQAEQAARGLAAMRQPAAPGADVASLRAQLEIQTARRERAETEAIAMATDAGRLQAELDQLKKTLATLAGELEAAEGQLLRGSGQDATLPLASTLRGQRVLYVGGRPSISAAIRTLVEKCGGEFRKHDGGLEERKGLLDAAVGASTLVVFPVDCIDHDSALRLKRLCIRQSIRFVPLRSASVASFAAGILSMNSAEAAADGSGLRRRHA